MITRVTSQMMTQTALRNLQGSMTDLARLQEQATSQKAFAKPSDDPAAVATAMGLHSAQTRNEQHARNINDGLAWVTTADNAITSSTALLGRLRDLTIQGANSGAMDVTSREAIAVELEGIREELLAQANTKYLGRSVFAGTSDAGAFSTTDYSYKGVPGSEVNRRVAEGQTVRVDAPGVEVFGEGAGSVFALVDTIVADLRSGTNVGSHIAAIDTRRNAMLGAQGAVGARQSIIERAAESALGDSIALETRRAAVEDVDSAEVLMQLQAKNLVYQSALAVTARAMPPSLMEFLS